MVVVTSLFVVVVVAEPSCVSVVVSAASVYVVTVYSADSSVAVVTESSSATVVTTGLSPALVSVSVLNVGSNSVVALAISVQVCAPSVYVPFNNVVLSNVHLVVTVVLKFVVVVVFVLCSSPPPWYTVAQSV